MSFRRCIDEALERGEIVAEGAAKAREAYDDAIEQMSRTFGPVEGDRRAGQIAMERLEREALERKRQRLLAMRTRRQMLEDIAGLKTQRGYQDVRALGGGDGKPPKDGWHQGGRPPGDGPGRGGAWAARALELKMENKPGLSGAPGASAEGRYRAIRGEFDAMMADLIERFETQFGLNMPGRAQARNIVREAFGEDTGDAVAKAMAKAWGDTAEHARRLYNGAGGHIGKLDGWGMPTSWDSARVRNFGREAWVEQALPGLNRDAMIDRATGLPFTEMRLRAVLGDVWESIATNGASRREAGEHLGKGALANSRADERFLIWRDADTWLKMQEAFGTGDPFEAMMAHLDGMARDIALMEVWGPNPAHAFEWMSRFALREAALEEAAGVTGASARAQRYVQTARTMMEHYNGEASMPYRPGVAGVGQAVRGGLTSVALGSAIVSEIPSGLVFGRMAREFAGLDRNGSLTTMIRMVADPKARATARRSGFIIEQATDGFVRATHDNLRLMTVGDKAERGANVFFRRLPVFTLRAQGMTGYVSARKRAHRFEFMGRLHDVRGRTLADLKRGGESDRALARWMEARGFTAKDWDTIRASEVWEPDTGAQFLLPRNVQDRDLAMRLAEAIELETRFVSPEATLWTRSKLVGSNQPGSVAGEARRSLAMYKSFSVTTGYLYAEEMALQAMARGQSAGSGQRAFAGALAARASGAMLWLTLAGAMAIQLRETVKGNDPRPMDDPRFWGAAMMQGGGLGILGDFFYAAEARNGRTAGIVGFGPVGQVTADLYDLTAGNVVETVGNMADGDDLDEAIARARPGRDLSRVMRNYSPLNTLVWARLAWNRGIADNLQRALDPEAEDVFERRARRLRDERGQGQWWPDGANLPERLPDPGNALERRD
ncbi:MAG: hypothetical protein ACK4E3_10465 [Brevundimonas sp.]|uniref:hypothetical protein n=1 Tax=Brevundimonas sp. TaxID=1871086 RepID=UPI00391DF18D